MHKNKIVLKWSKKENDWEFHYPDRAGNTLTGLFFEMLKIEENIPFIRDEFKDGQLMKRINPIDLKTMLTERGYDYKTLRITCEKIKPKKDEAQTNLT